MEPSTAAGLATLLTLLVVSAVLGRGLRRVCGGRGGERDGGRAFTRVLDLAGGLLTLHLSLLLLYGLGIRWTPTSVSVASALAISVVLATSFRRSPSAKYDELDPDAPAPESRSRKASPFSWGEGVAATTVLAFTAAAWTLRTTHPDFIYHWGIKGRKFLLAGGPDFTYLSHVWNHFVHPDYPRWIPELYALTSLPSGGVPERVLLLWSVVFFAGLLVALREALHRGGVAPAARQPLLVFLALALAAFVIGHRLAGGADLPLALALAAALPVLLAPALRPGDDLTLGLAAALAAAAKIEGVVLAGTLVAVHLLRRLRDGDLTAPGVLRALLPSSLVILPWLGLNLRHGLFQATNSGAFEAERWPTLLAGLGEALTVTQWHGLSWLILGAPLLLPSRRTRGVAGVVLVQVTFYLWIYFTQVGDPALLVRFSFPRLLLPLIPAVLVAGAVLLLPDGATGRSGDEDR